MFCLFSFRNFRVSVFTFRSLIHFEFIFVYGVKECSSFIFFTCNCPVFPAPFLEKTVFSPFYSLVSFVIDHLIIGAWIYFWASYPVPLIYISVFVPVPYCFDDFSFVVWSEVSEPDSSSSVFLSQDYFGYSGSFVSPYRF